MTPTNEQIIAEANRRRKERGMDGLLLADFIIEVMREGWTPPEPVEPDVLAFREWFAHLPGRLNHRSVLAGSWDLSDDARAYLAGARMAREQERERAKEVLDQAKATIDLQARLLGRLPLGMRTQIGIEGSKIMDATYSFYNALSKYEDGGK